MNVSFLLDFFSHSFPSLPHQYDISHVCLTLSLNSVFTFYHLSLSQLYQSVISCRQVQVQPALALCLSL